MARKSQMPSLPESNCWPGVSNWCARWASAALDVVWVVMACSRVKP